MEDAIEIINFINNNQYIKEGMTEKQIALEIEMFFKTHGADGLAFEPIVAIGENSANPQSQVLWRRFLWW